MLMKRCLVFFGCVFAQLIYCKSDLLLDEHVQICRFAERHSSWNCPRNTRAHQGAHMTSPCSLFEECQNGEPGQPKMQGTNIMLIVKEYFKNWLCVTVSVTIQASYKLRYLIWLSLICTQESSTGVHECLIALIFFPGCCYIPARGTE